MKHIIPIIIVSMAILFLLPLNTIAVTQTTDALQAEIDGAALGDIVSVPPGEYEGKLILRSGVALVSDGGDETIIDGADTEIVIEGAPDAILSNLTITGGKVLIDTKGAYMGIFDCTLKAHGSTAIHVIGGSAVIINNVIEGGSISCNSSNPLIICNTIVTTDTDGLWSWYGPGPIATNNCIVGAKHAIAAGAGSLPMLDNNAFWVNVVTFAGCGPDEDSIYDDPLFVDPEGGDLSLRPESPLIEVGKAVEGLWNGETPDVGWNAERSCNIEECRLLMDMVASDLVPTTSIVTYTLGETPGEFLVTTGHPVNKFTVCSSTANTPIEDIEAFDTEDEVTLAAELKEEHYPRVDVQSDKPLAPSPENRYFLENTYCSTESYYDDNGLRIFTRKTNFPNVIIEAPEGYTVLRATKNGITIDGDLSEGIQISAPGVKEIEVVLQKTDAPIPENES